VFYQYLGDSAGSIPFKNPVLTISDHRLTYLCGRNKSAKFIE